MQLIASFPLDKRYMVLNEVCELRTSYLYEKLYRQAQAHQKSALESLCADILGPCFKGYKHSTVMAGEILDRLVGKL